MNNHTYKVLCHRRKKELFVVKQITFASWHENHFDFINKLFFTVKVCDQLNYIHQTKTSYVELSEPTSKENCDLLFVMRQSLYTLVRETSFFNMNEILYWSVSELMVRVGIVWWLELNSFRFLVVSSSTYYSLWFVYFKPNTNVTRR